jgi:hypothetical protein
MAKFAIGDSVAKDKDRSGIVVGIFTNADGEPRYALDHDGELLFLLETELAPRDAARRDTKLNT